MTYNQKKLAVLMSDECSLWLKRSVLELEQRDVVDALNELDYLKELFTLKLDEFLAQHGIVCSK